MRHFTGFTFFICLTMLSTHLVGQSSCVTAHYPFDGNANDVSGNNYHGVINGNPQLTTDRYGNQNAAYLFDGVDDFIDTETSFDYQYRTVSAWFMADTGGVKLNVMAQDANSLTYGKFHAMVQPDTTLKATAGGTGSVVIDSNITINQWHHIALVRDDDSVRYYVNGVKVLEAASNTSGSFSDANPELVIGTHRSEAKNFFSGKIDDVKIHDCALSDQDITDLYTSVDEEKQSFAQGVKVYPNPANEDAFNLHFNNKTICSYQMTIHNYNGQRIYEKELIKPGRINYNVNLSDEMSQGVYLIRLVGEKGDTFTKKIIVQ